MWICSALLWMAILTEGSTLNFYLILKILQDASVLLYVVTKNAV